MNNYGLPPGIVEYGGDMFLDDVDDVTWLLQLEELVPRGQCFTLSRHKTLTLAIRALEKRGGQTQRNSEYRYRIVPDTDTTICVVFDGKGWKERRWRAHEPCHEPL